MSAESNTEEMLDDTAPSQRRVWLNRKLMIAGAILAAAVAFLIFNAMGGSAYYMTISELEARGSAIQGEKVRVAGDVVDGSIVRGDIGEEIRFSVTDGQSELRMVYGGDVPDIFADDAEVIATGTVGPDGVFVADELLTKCPSRFEADEGVSN